MKINRKIKNKIYLRQYYEMKYDEYECIKVKNNIVLNVKWHWIIAETKLF